MKKVALFVFGITMMFASVSCVDENNTTMYLGSTYEFQRDFITWDDYEGAYVVGYTFPVPLANTDGIMVYILWGTMADGTDIWRPLPQTIYTAFGHLMYSYDYTYQDVQIYLTPDYNPNLVQAGDLYDQVFRVVTLPANWAPRTTVDLNDYNAVIQELEASGYTYGKKIKENI